ncbi:hypothetical protein QL285_051319 [Trifolium repens]|nr:hypothetical protein QL285_051319 [Trifolium repens]
MKLLAQEVKKFKKKLKEAKNGQKGGRSSQHDNSHCSTMGYACWPRQEIRSSYCDAPHRGTMTLLGDQADETHRISYNFKLNLAIAAQWDSAAHYENYK